MKHGKQSVDWVLGPDWQSRLLLSSKEALEHYKCCCMRNEYPFLPLSELGLQSALEVQVAWLIRQLEMLRNYYDEPAAFANSVSLWIQVARTELGQARK